MKRIASIVPVVSAARCLRLQAQGKGARARRIGFDDARIIRPESRASAAWPGVGDFEGEIALLAKGKFSGKEGTPINLSLLIKDNRVRVDLPESLTVARGFGPVHLLALPADKKLYAILDSKKQAVLLDLDKISEQAKAFGGRPRSADPPSTPPRLEKTGKFDTVAGIQVRGLAFQPGKKPRGRVHCRARDVLASLAHQWRASRGLVAISDRGR